MPFYPTPDLDDGYDVTDHYGVDPNYGSLGDVVDFPWAAHEHGLRVIAAFVAAHNLAAEARTVRLDGVSLFTGEREGPELELEPYGYRWLRPAN